MWTNSSSSSNASLLPPQPSSSNLSLYPAAAFCFNYRSSSVIFIAFSFTNILLLLPVCILVLRLAFQRWRKQRAASTAAMTSHSDIFTYHMVATEMIGVFGCGFSCCGAFSNRCWLVLVGACFVSVTSSGHMLLHILTCVERYLAVVHPITYLGLRKRGGIRIRNVSIGCVWLLVLGAFSLSNPTTNISTVPSLCLLALCIGTVSFCSFSVLCALIRPGPGERGGDRERVDRLKIRAFHTIMAIMGALLLRFGGQLLVVVVYSLPAVSEEVRCEVLVSGTWFCLPSSLVLPLLFLHRAGQLACCKNKADPGPAAE